MIRRPKLCQIIGPLPYRREPVQTQVAWSIPLRDPSLCQIIRRIGPFPSRRPGIFQKLFLCGKSPVFVCPVKGQPGSADLPSILISLVCIPLSAPVLHIIPDHLVLFLHLDQHRLCRFIAPWRFRFHQNIISFRDTVDPVEASPCIKAACRRGIPEHTCFIMVLIFKFPVPIWSGPGCSHPQTASVRKAPELDDRFPVSCAAAFRPFSCPGTLSIVYLPGKAFKVLSVFPEHGLIRLGELRSVKGKIIRSPGIHRVSLLVYIRSVFRHDRSIFLQNRRIKSEPCSMALRQRPPDSLFILLIFINFHLRMIVL